MSAVRRTGGRIRRTLGVLMLALALISAGCGLYFFVGTDLIAFNQRDEVLREWDRQATLAAQRIGTEHREGFPTLEGEGVIGTLRVPRWGTEYRVPIGSGSGPEVLDTGQVGHYTDSTPIGALGNAALAGHRTSHGMPLREVHHLEDGDAIIVESDQAWLVYRKVAHEIVQPDRRDVLDPIPPFPGATQGRYLTLTTCDPIYGITERYIVWAEIDYWTPKSEGLPPDLAPGATA